MTRAALAVERYRLATGKLPEKLEDLVPDLLESVPVDPFDGQAVRYRKRDRGYVILSIGEDGTENPEDPQEIKFRLMH